MRFAEGARLALVPPLAAALIRLLRISLRIRHVGREPVDDLAASGQRAIYAFWHGRLLMMPYSYRGPRCTILVSQHRDGEYLSRTVERFGFHCARGSTTRGGTQGLRDVVRRIQEGYDLGITPDGPRGPRQRVQPGVIAAARLSGAPVVPLTFAARPARILDTWDGFLLPYPFSRGLFLYGEPFWVPRDSSPGRQEELRRRLESDLLELTRRADREV